MIAYLLPLICLALGFGVAWFIWGRAQIVAPSKPELSKKPKRKIRRPKDKAVTAHAGPAPFRVVTLDGEVHYEGTSGGDARRCIEGLRSQQVEWRAYRDGNVWDWGPR